MGYACGQNKYIRKIFLMWFHIRARDMNMYKPKGKVIQFWLFGETEKDIRRILDDKGCTDIEWIREEIPDWEK